MEMDRIGACFVHPIKGKVKWIQGYWIKLIEFKNEHKEGKATGANA